MQQKIPGIIFNSIASKYILINVSLYPTGYEKVQSIKKFSDAINLFASKSLKNNKCLWLIFLFLLVYIYVFIQLLIKSSPFGKFLAYLNNSSELLGNKLFNNL